MTLNSRAARVRGKMEGMTYQSGITGLGVTDHAYYELDLLVDAASEGKTSIGALAAAANLPSTCGANIVIGVRPELWAQVADPQDVPENVHGFNEPMQGKDGYSMPATQHDAWLYVASSSRSQCFDVSHKILDDLKPYFKVADETIGWVYEKNRDLTGFEDGTENPGTFEAPSVVAIPDGKPGAGASILLFQKWVHQTQEWESLSTEEQEDAIGRTKVDSVELDDEEKPESSHVARSVVEVDGEELDVYRRNVAYGDRGEHGTVFVGFTFDQWRMNEMLRRMAGADGGPRDMLTYFTTAITGSWYVCPSNQGLLRIMEATGQLEDED